MEMSGFDFAATDWSEVPEVRQPGETGEVRSRTLRFGDVRVRRVDYSPGYSADHWCVKGHVLFVIEGELVTTLDDGRVITTGPGNSYQVADDSTPHRSSTAVGARLLIVD
ncbi:DHCW motif cupin fold protein [Streptomyces sp. G2]|uniref:DHCW motif cupin fold protein n=1 Tax=Streptomyces TaxID=1883 RepID=UPI002030E21D|nr:DHCW motif cupin fold protein [Streptomyces sp. G2]MCM1951399.1 DHCW motif cupin fold protein [Streptomyces sp. G2]